MNRCLKCKTENADAAEFCVNCGFSLWKDALPAVLALEPPTRIMRHIWLDPEVVQVHRGESARIIATVSGGASADIDWQLTGSASTFATIEPAGDTAIITLHPRADAPAWALAVELSCVELGEVTGMVMGTVEVLPERPDDTPASSSDTLTQHIHPKPKVDVNREAGHPVVQEGSGVTTTETHGTSTEARAALLVAALAACIVIIATLLWNRLGYVHTQVGTDKSLFGATGGYPYTDIHRANTFTPLIVVSGIALGLLILSLALKSRVVAVCAFVVSLVLIGESIRVHSQTIGSPGHYGVGYWLSLGAAGIVALMSVVAAASSTR